MALKQFARAARRLLRMAPQTDPPKYTDSMASPVDVCFTAAKFASSWQIRGVQMAASRTNWFCASSGEVGPRSFEIACVVKWPDAKLIHRLKTEGKLVVLDVVDGWAQPEDDLRVKNLEQARELFLQKWKPLAFDAFIFPNRQMCEDLRDLVGPSTFLYHHYRPGLQPIVIRERPRTLGYEGEATYLGEWKKVLVGICREFDLRLVVNPNRITDLDIGFAGRGGPYDAFLANRYKSNVKLANFIGAGIPCVVSAKEGAYSETAPKGVRFFSTPEDLRAHIAALIPFETRTAAQVSLLKARPDFSRQTMAAALEAFFVELARGRAIK